MHGRRSPADGPTRLPGVERGREIRLLLDGDPLVAFEGETVAAAMFAAGRRATRRTARLGEPRGPYCGMGTCFECVLNIDGRPNVRSCRTPVREGLDVRTQDGLGIWRLG